MQSIIQRAAQIAVDNLKQYVPVANYFQAGRAFMTDIYGPLYYGTDFKDLVRNGYKKNTDVYAAVSLISRAASNIPFYLVEKQSDGTESTYYNPELERVLKNPSPMVTWSYFVEQAFTDYLLSGNQYNYTIDVDGKVREWIRLRPDYIAINTSSNLMAPIRSYQYSYGVNSELEVERVTHWRLFDPINEWYGMSPLEAAMRSVAMGNAAVDWNTATLQNMGRHSGILKFSDTLTQEQKDMIYQSYEDRLAGASRAGKPIVTDADFDYVQESMTIKDADWFNGLNLTKQQIASVFGIDSGLIGDKTASTYNNLETAMLRMYYDRVIPMLTSLGDIINRHVVSTWNPNVEIRFDFESIDAIKRDQAAAYTRLQNSWWLSPNERRHELGYEALEDPSMDQIYIPSGMIPINEANIDVNVSALDELPDQE
jgi:HK97 family phage portal protein